MGLTNTTVKQIYNGTGSLTTFAIPFDVIVSDSSEVKVYIRDTSVTPATETLQTLGVDYTLTGGVGGGFNTDVEFTTAPLATDKVLIIRSLPNTQTLDLSTSTDSKPEDTETQLDRLAAQIQELKEQVERAIKVPKSYSTSARGEVEPATDEFIAFNASGDPYTAPLTTTDATLATQAEAEAGTENTAYMSPLRVQQKITSDLATQSEAEQGTNNTQFMTALRVLDALKYNISPSHISNIRYSVSANAGALTIALKGNDLLDHSATNVGRISVKSGSATSGHSELIEITSAQSITIPSGATLGYSNGDDAVVHLYWLNTGVTGDELGVSSSYFDEGVYYSGGSTAISTGSDSKGVMYSTGTAPYFTCRYLGSITVAGITTAGTWTANTSAFLATGTKNAVLQYRMGLYGTEETTSSATQVNTSLQVSITPSSLTSRILLFAMVPNQTTSVSSITNYYMTHQLTNGGTAGTSLGYNARSGITLGAAAANYTIQGNAVIIGEEKPASLSQQTYIVTHSVGSTSSTGKSFYASQPGIIIAIEVMD